jgi:hypothetical protein
VRAPTRPATIGWIIAAQPSRFARHDCRCRVLKHGLLRDDHGRDIFGRRHLEHDRAENLFHDRAEPASTRLAQHGKVGDRFEGILLKFELNAIDLEHALVLAHQSVLGLSENVHQGDLIERRDRGDDGQSTDEFGNQPEFVKVFWQYLAEQVDVVALAVKRGAESDALFTRTLGDDLLEARERSCNDEQNVGRVDLNELLVRMLAPTLRRNGCDRALKNLEECLLHAFTRHVARDGRVLGLASDLVDLVDVDDAGLGALDVVVGGLNQLEKDVLHVFTDVPCFGEGRGIRDSEWNVETLRQRLREVRLATPRWADEQDVGLGDLDIVDGVCCADGVAGANALVVVIDGNRERLLGCLLADDVLPQERVDLLGLRQVEFARRLFARLGETFFDDLVAEFYALVTDVHAGPSNELLYLLLALPAERTLEQVRAFPNTGHSRSPLPVCYVCPSLTRDGDTASHHEEKGLRRAVMWPRIRTPD